MADVFFDYDACTVDALNRQLDERLRAQAAEIKSLKEKTQYWPDNAERDAVIRYQEEEIERQRAEIERLRAALREAASDLQMSLQIDKQKDAKIEQLTAALRGVVDDEPCWLDHHGYCQTHGLGKPCEMAIARAALEVK